jgi:hypothetical protein
MSTKFDDKKWRPRFYYILMNKTSGKKYLGQTTKCLSKYLGSGVYWKNHCKSNGGYNRNNIELLFSILFQEECEAKIYLQKFEEENPNYWSEDNENWANLCKENTEDNPFYSKEIASRNTRKMLNDGTHPFLKNNRTEYMIKTQVGGENFAKQLKEKYGVDNINKIPEIAKASGKKASITKNSKKWKEEKEHIRITRYNETMNTIDVNGVSIKQKRDKKIGESNKKIIDKKVKSGEYHLLNGFYAINKIGNIIWISSEEYKSRKDKGCDEYAHPTSREGKRRRAV